LFIIVFLSSPTFSNSPFLLILLQVVHLKLEENDFLVVFPCIFGSHGVELGNRHVNEEDDSGHSHSDPDYPMNEGEEGGEGDDNEVDSGKASLTPLWRYVTKLEKSRGGGTTKFLCPHGCRPGKPYSGSYARVRRHLCGVLDSHQ
jgi:hypothetical protein